MSTSTRLTAAAPPITGTAASDNLESNTYSGGTGWSSEWTEYGEPTSPTAGDVRIVSDGGSHVIRLTDSDNGLDAVERTANLDGATSATLSFDFKDGGLDYNETASVQISTDGTNYTTIATLSSSAADNYTNYSYDISSYISANTTVRLAVSTSLESNDYVYFDNVQITTTAPAPEPTGYETSTLTNAAPVAIASADTLITDTTSANLSEATITLTDPQAGDSFAISGTLVSAGATGTIAGTSITYAVSAGGDVITLSGVDSRAHYATAIEAVGFATSGTDVSDRHIEVQVADDTNLHSNVAVSTVTVERDTDGDGVKDTIDIDDDNDGILDTLESDPTTSTYSAEASTIAGSGTAIASPTSGYVVTDTSSDNTLSFVAVSPGESGDGVGTGTLSELTIAVDLAPGEELLDATLSLVTGAFDDGLLVRINGVTVVEFNQNDWDNSAINSKYGDGAGRWQPWDNEGNPILEIDAVSGDVRLMVDTATGGRENILADIAGSRPNELPTLDFVSGVTIASGFNNGSGPAAIGTQTLTFEAAVFNPRDSDGDGIADHLDIDSDNDGITDNVEAQTTAGYIAPSGTPGDGFTDIDGDGLDDAYDANTSGAAGSLGLTPVDTDSDGTADHLDTDSDNDGIADIAERGDGQPTSITSTADTDHDGLLDIFEGANVNDGFDVNDENLDATDTNFNLAGVPALNADGSNADPLTDGAPTVDLYFRDVNDAPVDGNETSFVAEDTLVVVANGSAGDLLNNSSDVDGDSLAITSYAIAGVPGTHAAGSTTNIPGVGTLQIFADGSYTFGPSQQL